MSTMKELDEGLQAVWTPESFLRSVYWRRIKTLNARFHAVMKRVWEDAMRAGDLKKAQTLLDGWKYD